MCEINPKHKKILRLEFFTSVSMTEQEWENLVTKTALQMEMSANEDGRIRCHIHDENDEHLRVVYEVPQRTANPRR